MPGVPVWRSLATNKMVAAGAGMVDMASNAKIQRTRTGNVLDKGTDTGRGNRLEQELHMELCMLCLGSSRQQWLAPLIRLVAQLEVRVHLRESPISVKT